MTPAPARLFAAMDATWVPAEVVDRDGWRLRRGLGGGGRVSSASPLAPGGDIALAEAQMAAWGQPPLFRLTPEDAALDSALAAGGYRITDIVSLLVAPAAALDDGSDHTARVIRVPHTLGLARELWAEGGLAAGRLAVMGRVPGGSALMARLGDRPAGMAWVAADGDIAYIHGIAVVPAHRRQGVGALLIQGAARFALEAGAAWLALAVSQGNAPALALYAKLGMAAVTNYHYRGRE